jgi:hypothetical protein
VYTVDFDDLAKHNITTGNVKLKEKRMRGALPLHPATQVTQYGTYDISPEMVVELNTMILEQLVRRLCLSL